MMHRMDKVSILSIKVFCRKMVSYLVSVKFASDQFLAG